MKHNNEECKCNNCGGNNLDWDEDESYAACLDCNQEYKWYEMEPYDRDKVIEIK